jgi:hypothetical protein
MIAKCLNCNQDYEQETQGAICPHAVGGPNSLPPWPKLKQPFPEIWKRYEEFCKAKGRHALHGDLWQGFLAGSLEAVPRHELRQAWEAGRDEVCNMLVYTAAGLDAGSGLKDCLNSLVQSGRAMAYLGSPAPASKQRENKGK